MVTIEKLSKIEDKYKNMEDGVSVLSEKVRGNDAINIMANNFRVILGKKNVGLHDVSVLSDIFSFSLIMFEEALEEERKERFFDFVSSTFSKEFLKGKAEKELFSKTLKRVEKKLKKEEKLNIDAKNN